MLLIIFQIIFVLFVVIAIAGVIQKRTQGLLGKKGTSFWILFWLIVGLVIVWPDSTQKLADYIGIGRGVDLVLYISIFVIFFVLFRMNIKVEGLKRDLTKVVRKDALKHENFKS